MKRGYSQHRKHLAPRLCTGKGILGSREKDGQTEQRQSKIKISVGLKGERVTVYINSYKKQAECRGKSLSEAG